jgi:hypothetical protein
MNDDKTRNLFLRLQMGDLATIWASSTPTNDDAELDAGYIPAPLQTGASHCRTTD